MGVVAKLLLSQIKQFGAFLAKHVLIPLFFGVAHLCENWIGPVLKKACGALGKVLARSLYSDPKSQKVFKEVWDTLVHTFAWHYGALVGILFLVLGAWVIFVGRPLLQRFITRRSVAVFLSFNRAREDTAKGLQNSLKSQGVNVTRIPYRDDAQHQEIVQSVSQGLRACHALLCVPGGQATFVDSEVMAAGAGGKAVIFLLSEADGTLPNTADKRYPVFKLEESEAHEFEPLIRFLRYIGSDFASLVDLFRSALGRAGNLLFRTRRGWLILALTLAAIAVFSYFDVLLQGASGALKFNQHYPGERAAAVLANTLSFGALGVFSLFTAEYAAVALTSVRRQELAQKRAALEVSAATFLRDDWLGLVPGLEKGSAMYQCMFERQALAHHEAG